MIDSLKSVLTVGILVAFTAFVCTLQDIPTEVKTSAITGVFALSSAYIGAHQIIRAQQSTTPG